MSYDLGNTRVRRWIGLSEQMHYILWLSDEKIADVSKEILEQADEVSIEQRMDEAMDGELDGMRFWDIYGDDD